MFFDIGDGVIKGSEVLVRDNGHACFFEFFLSESSVVFEFVCVGCAANDVFALCSEFVCVCAVTEDVIENNDVCPVNVSFPFVCFGDEAVADFFVVSVFNVVFDVVSLFDTVPCDVDG